MQDIKLLTGPKVDINQIRWRDDPRRDTPANQLWNTVKAIIDQPVNGLDVLRNMRKMHLNAEFGPIGRRADIRAFDRIKMLAPSTPPDIVRDIKFPKVWFDEADNGRVPLDVNKPIPHWLERDLNMNHRPLTPNWFWPVVGRQRSGAVMHEVKVLKARPFGGNHILKLKAPDAFMIGNDGMPKLKEPPVDLKGEPVRVDVADAIKALFKSPQNAAKEGLRHDHPANKGKFFAGREKNKAPLQLPKLDVVRPDISLCDVGAFHDIWREWAGLGRFAGGIGVGVGHNNAHIRQEFNHPVPARAISFAKRNTAEQAAHDKALENIRKTQARRENERRRLEAQKEDAVESYIRVCLKLMAEPGANWCQLIACMYDKLKNNFIDDGTKLINDGLFNLGFKLLGNGHFSTAYQGPDGFVYKVNANHNGSDAWFVYAVNIKCSDLMWCVPRIDKIAHKGNTYCVTMERLEPMTRTEFLPYDGLQAAIRDCEFNTVAGLLDISRFDAAKLIKLVNTTRGEAGGNCRFDIHHENIMFRVDASGRKRPVLTDPLAYGKFQMYKIFAKLTEHQQAASTLCEAA